MPLPITTVSALMSFFSAGADATSISIQRDSLRSSPTFMTHSPWNLSQGANVREPDFVASVRPVALAFDRRDARAVGGLQIAPALQDLEGIFLVAEAERLGLLQTEQRHVARLRFPCGAVRVLPGKVD